MESFKLITSMEDAMEQERQARATVDLFESIAGLDDADKAEELLGHIAVLQGVDRESVSLESLGGLIQILRKLITPEQEPSKNPRDLNELRALFSKYYLNNVWLSKQSLVEGEVEGTSIGEALSRRGKFDATTFAHDFVKYAAELKKVYLQYVQSIVPYAAQIKALDNELVGKIKRLDDRASNYTEQVVALVKETVAAMEKLETPIKKMDGKFDDLGGWTTTVKGNALTSVLVHRGPALKKVKALTKEDIIALCKTVLDLYETVNDLAAKSPEFCNVNDTDHDFVEVLKDEAKKLGEAYVLHASTFEQMRRLLWMTGVAAGVNERARVSIKWIDRSIKTE